MGRLTGLLKVVRAAGGVSAGNRPFVVRQLAAMGADLTKIEGLESEFTRSIIAPAFTRASDRANIAIRSAGFQLTNAAQTGLELQTLRQLEVRVARDLSAVRTALGTALALNDPNRRGPRMVERALESDGAVRSDGRVRTPSGRFWEADKYARMLTRTAVADARREAFRTRYLANGVDVVYVVPNGSEHDVCLTWEGRLLSMTGATPGLPTIDEARSAGLFHPNCRHRYVVASADRLADAGLDVAPIPTTSIREGLNRVQPTVALSTLGRPAPQPPGRTLVPTAIPNPRQPSQRGVSPSLLRAARR
jgi:hypothetical protein